MTPICLTHQELHELTGKSRFSAQIRALARMQIPYRVRPDGSPAVLRSDLHLADGATVTNTEPDYSSLRA